MSGPITGPISPGLVLVDPELAARIRAAAAFDHAASAPWLAASPNVSPQRSEPAVHLAGCDTRPWDRYRREAPHVQSERRTRNALDRLGVIGGVVALLLVLSAAFLPPRQAPHLGAAPLAATTTRPTLNWPRRAAVGYRVEVLSRGRLVVALRTRVNHLVVPRWLGAGRYSWRVSVGDRPSSRGTDPPWLERGWFIVPR